MLDFSLMTNYIGNIPNSIPSKCFIDSPEIYKTNISNIFHKAPAERINYDDNVWDFRYCTEDINASSYVIKFGDIEEATEYLKAFVVYQISKGIKISTTNNKIYDFNSVIKSLIKDIPFSLITSQDIINEIDSKDVSLERKKTLSYSLFSIYDFINKNYKETFVNTDEILDFQKRYSNKMLDKTEKYQNIPDEYYNIIIRKLVNIIDDNNIDDDERMTAGLIIICSQTGLRSQDLLGLKTDALIEKFLPVSNVKCHYLHFQSRKPSKGNQSMVELDIYASELCAETFNKMLNIRKSCIYSSEPYLYVVEANNHIQFKIFPLSRETFLSKYQRLFVKYFYNEINQDWEGIKRTKSYVHNDPDSKTYKDTYYSIPTLMNFRVHFATSLYNKGVSLTYIERNLGHLSEMMKGYYVRPKNNIQENSEYAKNIIKKIVNDGMTPLGSMGKELKDNLLKFIKDGNYNVKTDVSKIINDLGEKLIIREKGGGYCCIKTSIIPCKNDARTDEVLCAYGLCPNIYHFYDMIDVTYMQFHGIINSYTQNSKAGYTKQAQKELVKLKDFIKRRFLPEIIELEKTLNDEGVENFSTKHPELKYIALNIDNIKKEVKEWQSH